jgi:tetraacyldisaccharide 4'-kinase
MRSDGLRAALGRRLEQGTAAGTLARLLAVAWEAGSARAVARPLRLPPGVRLVGVGGAVLGGAGKTPVAIALARAFAERGAWPALVGHAYRARPGGARVVRPGDVVAVVGDDALAAARVLAGVAEVVVAPRRQAAIDHAVALGHRLLIADGLLQAAPDRLAAAVLVLDAAAPWGAGACPPIGDLRAPRAALLEAADVVAALQAQGTALDPGLPAGAVSVPSRIAGAVSSEGEAFGLSALGGLRVGLLLTVARPGRVVSALARAGVRPEVTLCLADHAVPTVADLARAAGTRVEVWLTTARCATKLPAAIGGRPVLALDHRLDVADLVGHLATRAGE